jgi:EAL domain-containing protein (putative c-di-GMP-specific phosphodiesterase class I)/GGDEF domain-containing protein
MDKARSDAYYIAFEKLVDSMTDHVSFSRDAVVSALRELCSILRIAKGVTEFYVSTAHEIAGDGEILCDYDNGMGDTVVSKRRVVSKSGAVIKGTLYSSSKDKPLDDDEIRRADLVMRTVLSTVSRNRLSRAIVDMGYHDERGFRNHRAYVRFLEKLSAADELGGMVAAQFNLCRFNLINQDIGRHYGDIVMMNYYKLVDATVSPSGGTVCRLGGDNFVTVFKKEHLSTVLEIFDGVPVSYDEAGTKHITVSARSGLYEIPEDFIWEGEGTVMDKIIFASNAAKRSSETRIIFYDARMINMRNKMMRVQSLFPEALRSGEFRPFYQPKVDISTGLIVGAEALCRWFHDGKLIPPNDFIPIFEQNTDICKLDMYMLEAVCRDIRRWLDSGRNAVRISVNFSRKNLVDIELTSHIIAILEKYSIPHDLIEIELTETTTDVEFRDLKRIVSSLQLAGICTSVDDFGMGYSSLNLIREIPWNVLKIDRCFLPAENDGDSSVTSLMYRYVISMARAIGLECITEGVETMKQIEVLRDNNCMIAQGFFFDKPLPVEEFENRLDMMYYHIK